MQSAPSAEEELLKERWANAGGSAETVALVHLITCSVCLQHTEGGSPGEDSSGLRTEKHMPCAGRRWRWPWEEAGPRRAGRLAEECGLSWEAVGAQP